MQTIIHYATPPGWRPRRPLPTLQRGRVPGVPGSRARGGDLRVRTGVRPESRPAPESRRNPSDWDGPQDSHEAAALGLPWGAYLAGTVVFVVLLLVTVWRVASGAPASVPMLTAGVGLAFCLWGLADYARAGAVALREGDR